MAAPISIACEGVTDAAVARRMVAFVGGRVDRVDSMGGKPALLENLPAYTNAAQVSPWLVLLDLDRDECAPAALDSMGHRSAGALCLRFAVRTVESWLMADRHGMARFLNVPLNRLPVMPDEELDPVGALLGAARRSKLKWVREDLLPWAGSGRKRGPGYSSRMIEFVQGRWNIEAAMEHSPSLTRAVSCVRRVVEEIS